MSESSAYRLLIQPDHGIDPVLALIESARISLRLKQFTVTDPRIIRALVAAHERKVEVRVLLNPTRPDQTRDNDETFATLERIGVAVQWTNPEFTVTHEKSMVIDEVTALVATFNLAPKYFGETRDYGIITHKLDEVAEIKRCFEADWTRSIFQPGHTPLVWSNLNARLNMALQMDTAKEHLDIQHPKFCDLLILERIMEAFARGVKVRVLCSGTHGVRAWDRVETFSSLRMMQKLGIPVHRMKSPKLHAKLVLIDRHTAFTGSMNIHHRAFDERRELGIILNEKSVVHELADTFHRDWEESSRFEVPDPLVFDQHADHSDMGD